MSENSLNDATISQSDTKSYSSDKIYYDVSSVENAFMCLDEMQHLEDNPNFGQLTDNVHDNAPSERYDIEKYNDKINSKAYTDVATSTLAYNIWFFTNKFNESFSDDVNSKIDDYLTSEEIETFGYDDETNLYDINTNLQPKNNSDIAHRGSHPGGIWENSVEAFEEAGKRGFWGCETDVRFDNDGNLVCSHNTVKAGENPPSFSEYLDICKKYGMTAIIDLKYENGFQWNSYDSKLSPEIIKTIEEKGMMDSCVIQTNWFNDIPFIRSQSDDVRIWLLGHNSVTDDNIELAIENDVECINFNNSENNSYRIKKVSDAGIDVCVWNVQTELGKKSCLGNGATYVMSDETLGISPYQEGDVDFNNLNGNYKKTETAVTDSDYEAFFKANEVDDETMEVLEDEDVIDNEEDSEIVEEPINEEISEVSSELANDGTYDGEILVAPAGYVNYDRADGTHVKETWCDLGTSTIVKNIKKFEGEKEINGVKIKDMEYWVRDDGVKMLGDYVIVAADVKSRKNPWTGKLYYSGGTYEYGDVVETTLGTGLIIDYCEDAVNCRKRYGEDYIRYDIYTAWHDSDCPVDAYADDYVPKNYANDPLLEHGLSDTTKPVEETPTPVEEPSKPVEETPTPVEEPSKPVEETPTPVEEPSKPVEETPTPVEEPSKPVEETPTPVEEPSKPVEETPTPVEEPSKSVEETPTPVEEPSKPVEETPTPVEEPIDSVKEPDTVVEIDTSNDNNNSNSINVSDGNNNSGIDGKKIIIPGILGTGLAYLGAKLGKIIKKKKKNDEV